MQVTPVRFRRSPQYPTQSHLIEHPELLSIVPERWRSNPLVLRVLAGVVSLTFAAEAACVQAQKPPASHVAPLFIHGEGRGAFGCVAINPPVFLSEDEAKQVIREEAKKAGLDFASDGFMIKDAQVPVTREYWCGEDEKASGEGKVQRKDLILTGFDKNHNVAFEFVSTDEIRAWQPKDLRCVSSVSSYDLKGTAESLRTGLQSEKQLPWIGVFYEPSASASEPERLGKNASEAEYKAVWEKREKDGKEKGEKELRKQVRDFIQWLKAQGVI
jgi:hypothetical protein